MEQNLKTWIIICAVAGEHKQQQVQQLIAYLLFELFIESQNIIRHIYTIAAKSYIEHFKWGNILWQFNN